MQELIDRQWHQHFVRIFKRCPSCHNKALVMFSVDWTTRNYPRMTCNNCGQFQLIQLRTSRPGHRLFFHTQKIGDRNPSHPSWSVITPWWNHVKCLCLAPKLRFSPPRISSSFPPSPFARPSWHCVTCATISPWRSALGGVEAGTGLFSEGEFGTLVGGRAGYLKKNTAGMNFEVVFDDFDDLPLLLSCFIPKICCLEVTKSLGSTFGSMLGVIYVRAFRLFSRTNH